ncbi:hypothetical protein KRX57_09515 [Weeksellaceae bacterium TAE3-ERU29]|nr:hypothetical protein [Weeksellaceae bacterium TAE3-ERU29]
MKKLLPLLLLITLLSSCCKTKEIVTKQDIYNRQKLEQIKEISVNSFFNQWLRNKRISKIDINIKKLTEDKNFTYFLKPEVKFYKIKERFFKVNTDSLIQYFPNYSEFYSDDLYHYLNEKIIPKEEWQLWHKVGMKKLEIGDTICPSNKRNIITDYTLKDKKVFITFIWDVKCKTLETLKNKTYRASYNLITKEYKNETITTSKD